MSDAFRSELEAAQERLRRAEEKIATLSEEKKELEEGRGPRPRVGLFLLAGVIIGGAVGGLAVRTAHEAEDRRETALREAAAKEVAASQEARIAELKRALESALTAHPPPVSASAVAPVVEACNCQPGDPLCACDPPPKGIDRAKVTDALQAIPIDLCARESARRRVHVKLTFLPSGSVIDPQIDEGGDALTEHERACILGALAKAKVPAFDGGPAGVGRSYTLGKAPAR